MTSPIKAVSRGVGDVFQTVTKPFATAIDKVGSFIGKAFDGGGSKAQAPSFEPPPLAPAAQIPTQKPARRGLQSSFLSGVASSGLSGSGGLGGGKSGKTLLGQ